MLAAFDVSPTVQGCFAADRRLGREVPSRPAAQPTPGPTCATFTRKKTSRCSSWAAPNPHPSARLVLRAFNLAHGSPASPAEIERSLLGLLDDLPRANVLILIPRILHRSFPCVSSRAAWRAREMWPDLCAWSNDMVAVYQIGRTRATKRLPNPPPPISPPFLRRYVERASQDPRVTTLITKV